MFLLDMPNKKEKLYLDHLDEELKNPSPNKYVLIYTEEENGDKPVNKPKKDKMTLTKLANEMREGFKQINTRLDYIVKANNLKDLPKNK